jgi:hypothetical protein
MIRTRVAQDPNVRPTKTPSVADAFAACGRPASKKTKFACDSVRGGFSKSTTAFHFTRSVVTAMFTRTMSNRLLAPIETVKRSLIR